MSTASQPAPVSLLTVPLPPDLKSRLRVLAAHEGVSMATYARTLLASSLQPATTQSGHAAKPADAA